MRFEKFAALIEVKGYHGIVGKRVGMARVLPWSAN
jgi:hypothetical protein